MLCYSLFLVDSENNIRPQYTWFISSLCMVRKLWQNMRIVWRRIRVVNRKTRMHVMSISIADCRQYITHLTLCKLRCAV